MAAIRIPAFSIFKKGAGSQLLMLCRSPILGRTAFLFSMGCSLYCTGGFFAEEIIQEMLDRIILLEAVQRGSGTAAVPLPELLGKVFIVYCFLPFQDIG